jgi:hypothetical protein
MPSLGQLKIVDPRTLWVNEERDFTPWIAANVERLGEVIGVPFTVEQTEKRVGAYELDIYGRVEGTDAPVIIENQLTPTDHRHLGQLITYASGLDAALIIWVAAEVTDEHRAAVEWLNKNTTDAVSFFLIRTEVMQIDDSKPAVKFVIEASPSEFKRVLRDAVEGVDAPRHEFRRKFWTALLSYLAAHGQSWASGRRAPKDSWISSSIGRSGVGVNVSMAMGSRMRVEIYCGNDSDKSLFNTLFSHKVDIESLFPGEAVSWEPLEDATASRIAVYRPYVKDSVSEDSPERQALFAWIELNLRRMRNVAKQYLGDGATL